MLNRGWITNLRFSIFISIFISLINKNVLYLNYVYAIMFTPNGWLV